MMVMEMASKVVKQQIFGCPPKHFKFVSQALPEAPPCPPGTSSPSTNHHIPIPVFLMNSLQFQSISSHHHTCCWFHLNHQKHIFKPLRRYSYTTITTFESFSRNYSSSIDFFKMVTIMGSGLPKESIPYKGYSGFKWDSHHTCRGQLHHTEHANLLLYRYKQAPHVGGWTMKSMGRLYVTTRVKICDWWCSETDKRICTNTEA